MANASWENSASSQEWTQYHDERGFYTGSYFDQNGQPDPHGHYSKDGQYVCRVPRKKECEGACGWVKSFGYVGSSWVGDKFGGAKGGAAAGEAFNHAFDHMNSIGCDDGQFHPF